MRRLGDGKEHSRLIIDSPQSNTRGLLKAGTFSLLLHIGLIFMLGLSLKPAMIKTVPSVYRVTIRPFSPLGNGIPQGSSSLDLLGPPGGLPYSTPVEKPKPIENTKRSEIVEKIKPQTQKAEKPEKGKSLEKGNRLEKGSSLKSLQEAVEDIDKKVALDEIQKRVARREKVEKLTTEGKSVLNPSQGPIISSSKSTLLSGPISGTGWGPGTGTGPGSTTFSTDESTGEFLWGSSVLESKLNDYYNRIWAKIKEEWTLPENLPKGKIDLETTIIVIIDREGKVQKLWFEKRSGNVLYDQMASRAIKKAEPFPPIPKEFSDKTFEIGIRFHPE
jgi:TonB family protein